MNHGAWLRISYHADRIDRDAGLLDCARGNIRAVPLYLVI